MSRSKTSTKGGISSSRGSSSTSGFDPKSIEAFNAEDYINSDLAYRAITLYGMTGTGKTTIICDFLQSLKEFVDIGCVLCPTESSYGDIFPDALVHDKPSIEIIEKLIDYQKMRVEMWSLSHKVCSENLVYLRELYGGIPDNLRNPKTTALITKFSAEADKKLRALKKSGSADLKKEAAKIIETEMKYYRDALSDPDVKAYLYAVPNLKTLYAKILDYIDVKPGFVMILDDCTELYDGLAKSEAFKELFYRGRHYKMILILSVHAAAALKKCLRQNVALAVCTTPDAFMNFAKNSDNKPLQKIAPSIVNTIFTEDNKHQKVVIKVPTSTICSYVAETHTNNQFCDEQVWEYLRNKNKKKHESYTKDKRWR